MGLLKHLVIGNIAGGQTLVIDVNGNARILLDGEQPSPGEVVLNSNGTSGAGSSDVQVGLIDPSGAAQDITLEVEDIFAALEGGQDPTQLGDDFATAAGGEAGSSLTGTGTIDRDGSETLAETNFETDGFESLGLSETQSITLIELEQQSAPFFSDDNGAPLGESITVSTDEDTDVAGLLAAIDPDGDALTFELTPDGAPANGTVTLNPDGSWNYTPNTDFDGTDSFTATVSDGLGGVDTLVVNIIVNPIPEISVSGGGLVNEGSDAVFVVDFDKASNQTTSLNLSTNLLTAESDDIGEIQVVTNLDQVLTVNLDGSVDVPPGVTSLTVTVPTVQDDVFEGDESFGLIVQPLSGLLGGGSSNAIIKDDGNGPGEDPDDDTPTLNVSDAQQVQEGTDAQFDVSLSNLVDADVTYNFAINLEGQTAELADFESPTFSVSYQFEGELFELDLIGSELTIPGTATDLVVSVSTVNDDIFEGVESFELLVDASFSVEGSTIELDGSGSGSIVDDGDEVNNDMPALTVSDAGQVVEGSIAEFDVSLDKEVDGTLNYVFSLDVTDPLTAEMADFLANGSLIVSYTDSDGLQSIPISNGGNLDIPGDATGMTVTVGTYNDDIFEGVESFELDVTVTGSIGDNNEALNLSDSGSATIIDDGDEVNNDTPVLTVSDAGQVVEGNTAAFDVSLDKEVDGTLNYVFSLDVTDPLTAEMADFLASGNLIVSYTDSNGAQSFPISNGGNLDIPGDATGMTVTVGTYNDEIFEGVESFELDVTVTGSIGDNNEALNLSDSGSATIIDDGGEVNNDTPVLTVSDAGQVVEGSIAEFDVSLDKDVDGTLNYVFTLDVADPLTAEMADFLANGNLIVSYTDSNGAQSIPISNGGNLDIPGDATGMTVTVGTYNDDIFEGVESFELDVTVTGSIGNENEALNLSDSGSATIIDDGGEVNNDTPVLTVSDAGQVVEGSVAEFDVSLDKEVDGTLNYVFSLDVTDPLTAEMADFLANGSLIVSYTDSDGPQSFPISNGGNLDIPGDATGMTVTVGTYNDDIFEGVESFELDVTVTGSIGDNNEALNLSDSGSATIIDDGGEVNNDTPVLTVSDAGQVVEGSVAEFDVSLDKEVDGTLNYVFTLDVADPLTAEMADFLANGNLIISYTDSNGLQSIPISNGGDLDIPGDATGMTVTVGTYNDEIFEGVESFELDVTVTGSIGNENEALNLSDSGSATIIDDGGEVNNDTPVLTVSDAGQVVEGNPAQFGVSLDKEVDGTLNYVFTLDVADPLTAEMADFLANGNLIVSYTDSDGLQSIPISNGGNLDIPGDATGMIVTVGTYNDEIFEGVESFELDVTVTGSIGNENEALNLSDSGNATIIDDGGEVNNDTPALTVSDAGQVVEGSVAEFDVSLDKEVDGTLNYVFTLDVADPLTAEMADFLANGNLIVSYTDSNGAQSFPISNGGNLNIPGDATGMTVTVGTYNDDIFEGVESFELDVTVTGSIGDNNEALNLSDSGSATIIDDGGEVNNDTPVLTVSDAGQMVEGNTAAFDVSLDKEVDGTLNYVFTLDVADPLTAEMADFLANGNLIVSYTDSDGPQSIPISNGGNLDIPGDATGMTVTVGTYNDEIFEGVESFELDVTVTGSIGDNNEALNLSDSGSATIIDDGGEVNNDTPVLTVSDAGQVVEGSVAEFDVSLDKEVDGTLNYVFTLDVADPLTAEMADFLANGNLIVSYTDSNGPQSFPISNGGNLNIPGDATGMTVTVGTYNDDIFEGVESFELDVTVTGSIGDNNEALNLSDSGSATIIDDGGEVNNDTPVLTVSDAGQVVEGSIAEFDVSLDKEVDGTLNYVFTLDVADPLTAEMADFLANGNLIVSYTDSNGLQSIPISNGGNLDIPGDATGMTVTVGTYNDDIFEGVESFELDVTVTGSIGDNNEALNLSDSGSATIIDDGGEVNNDTPVLTVSDAGQVVEGNTAAFDVSLDKEVDGTLNYVFTLDVADPLTAEMADFLANGNLIVSYTDSNGLQSIPISNGGDLDIPGDATNMTVTVGTLDDDTFEGAESFNLDVTVTGSIGNENEALNLSDSGSATIVEFTVEGPVDLELQDANTVGDSIDVNSGDLTFSAGENNIVSYEFGSTAGISVSGLDGSISWSVDNNGKLIGSVNNVALLSIALIGGTISAGTLGSVTVEATLLDNMQHEIDTDNISINGIVVNAVDSENQLLAATVNIDVVDDSVAISTGDLTTYNQPGTYVGDDLLETTGADTLYEADLSGNIQGWDPDNGVTFADSGLSSSGITLYYYVDPNNPDVLYAYTDTADEPSEFGSSPGTQELVFTLTADPNNNRYQIELERAIDSISSVAIADLTEGEGGINEIVYVGFNPDLDPDFDLDYDIGQLEPNYELAFTLTATSSDGTEGNVNGSNNGFGVDNPAVDVDEILTVDFVDDVLSASFAFTGSIFAYFVAYDGDGVVVDSGDFYSGESLAFSSAVSYVELSTSTLNNNDNFQFIGATAEVIQSSANDVSLQFDVTVSDSDGDSTSGNFTIDLNAPSEMTLTGTDNDGRLIGSEGDDTFIGNSGADLFTVLDGYLDGSTDVIKDFNFAEGDRVDISDLFENLSEQDVTDIMADIASTLADKPDDSGATVEIEDSNNNTLVIEFEGLAAVDLSQDLEQIFIVKDD